MSAYENLRSQVRRAIAEYDENDDHLSHAAGADCVRCNLEAVLTGAEPKGFQRTRRPAGARL